MYSETSKWEENKEASADMEFHDTSSSAVSDEVLIVILKMVVMFVLCLKLR
jgi:hypothetical protein